MADKKENLFSDFAPVSSQDWLDKINVDLKGADFEKRLVWKTAEGFKVNPFYRKEDLKNLTTTNSLPGEFPYLRGTRKDNNAWYVRQDIVVNSPEEANKKALDLLNKGVDSLGFKVKAGELDDTYIATLLDGIYANMIELNFEVCQRHAVKLAELLVRYFEKKAYNFQELHGSISFDPYNALLTKGVKAPDFTEHATQLIETLSPLPAFKAVTVTARNLCNAGAYIYQELGYALAWGNDYLNKLIDAGTDPSLAARKIRFSMGISSNYFIEIAKFRAARMLWAQIVNAYKPCDKDAPATKANCDAAKMYIHAETSHFNLTLYDAHVNLLRTQTEAMSAALGGVDSMTVTPFDYPYSTPDEFSERLARNQQLLLKEESHFDKVIDPAAGSYYIETLTASIAQQAWNLFLQVEDEGGFETCIQKGTVQDAINASNQSRHDAVSKRREILLGTNQFPNFTETAGNKTPIDSKPACGCSGSDSNAPYKTLTMSRASSEFEAIRLQTEKSGKTPVVFMLTIGNLAMRQARAQFACNFFACAGYHVIDNLGFETVEAGIEAALQAQANIVVLCSSDDEYATYAVPAFETLNNRAEFVIAGNPACAEELRSAGVTNFIHVRVNVLETLKAFNQKLGIN